MESQDQGTTAAKRKRSLWFMPQVPAPVHLKPIQHACMRVLSSPQLSFSSTVGKLQQLCTMICGNTADASRASRAQTWGCCADADGLRLCLMQILAVAGAIAVVGLWTLTRRVRGRPATTPNSRPESAFTLTALLRSRSPRSNE
jgi:hypothetical protein